MEMCLERAYSAIAKYPEFLVHVSKTGQNEKFKIFRKLASQKSMCDYLKIFKTYI